MTTTTSADADILARLRRLEWTGESQLPVPPQSVIEFSIRSRHPDVTVAELSAIVECEPALTIELLKNVNSCLRGLRQQVVSAGQAISLLGIPSSATILLTSALSQAVEKIESPLIAATDYRRESVERAVFARETAHRMKLDCPLAYTAAMLQDILLPLLTRRFQVEYHDYLHSGRYESLTAFERERFGWTHPEITAKTLLQWGFSDALALAVLRHHDSPEQLLVDPQGVSLAFPVCAAGLLMDGLNQSPDGVTRLVDLRGIDSRFELSSIAADVDAALQDLNGSLRHPVSLVQRLQNAMLNQLEQRRKQSVALGRQFGNYVLEEQLRESSMGAIYRARHIRLKRPAALKILRADRMNAENIAQFEREVQLTAELRHPNTVSIFDFGHTPDDLFYYAMELVDGVTLAELVKMEGRLPDGRVISILRQVCGSLTEAHQQGLIHRDIKPENIMISNRSNHPDHVTVLDFGLVASTADRATTGESPRGVVGTPLYMSPEAAHGRETVDARSDLYSLAAVGYCLLTGTPLFTGRAVLEVLQQHIRSTPIPPRERCDAEIAGDFETLLMKCLAKEPSDRPASAQELSEALAACAPAQPWGNREAGNWWEAYARRKAEQLTANGGDNEFASTLVATRSDSLNEAEILTLIGNEVARNTVMS